MQDKPQKLFLNSRKVLRVFFEIVAFACSICFLCSCQKNEYYEITQYGLNDGAQAMFYIIKSPDGKLVVIDGGTKDYATYVRQVLAQEGNKIDSWIITHPHEDHIGAFLEIMKDPGDISVSNIYTIDIDYDYYSSVAQEVDRIDVYDEFLQLNLPNIKYLHEGDEINLIGLKMEVFNAYTNEHKDGIITGNLMNQSSLVFKVTNKKESMLFCSDTENQSVWEKEISLYGNKLKADYMQVGHHGASYNEDFFYVVGANELFVDAPKALREWEDYPVYGNLKLLEEKGYTIYTYETVPNTIFLY